MTEEITSQPIEYEPVPINVKAFRKYVKKYGIERAKGYFDAMHDMTNNINGVFHRYVEGEYLCGASVNKVRTNLTVLKAEAEFTLKQISSLGILGDVQVAKGDDYKLK